MKESDVATAGAAQNQKAAAPERPQPAEKRYEAALKPAGPSYPVNCLVITRRRKAGT